MGTAEAGKVADSVAEASVEVLTREELLGLFLGGGGVRAYIGIEPSNVLHLGTLVACEPLLRLAAAGHKGIFLLADIHAWLNDKGELDELHDTARRNHEILARVARARGIREGVVEFVYGSSYQLEGRYILELFKLAKIVAASEARKAMDMISKKDVMHKVGSEVYALMQCLDIGYLGVNIAIGGMDQRKIHVMAREYLRRLGYPKPVAIHTPIILGLDGKAKMSKSLNNALFLNDDEATVAAKIHDAFCPERAVDNNPLIMIAERIVFPWLGSIEAGGRTYEVFSDLVRDWRDGVLRARALKDSVAEAIIRILRRIAAA